MSVTFAWEQTYDDESSKKFALVSNLNMGNTYKQVNINSQEFPITAGLNSYEIFIRGKFVGTWTTINNVYFSYISGALVSGETLFVRTNGTTLNYQTPTKQNSTIAVSSFSMGTSSPVSISGSISNALTSNANNSTSGAFTDYIVLQLRTSTNAVAGFDNTKTFQISYDIV